MMKVKIMANIKDTDIYITYRTRKHANTACYSHFIHLMQIIIFFSQWGQRLVTSLVLKI